jgi:hypothetical protein
MWITRFVLPATVVLSLLLACFAPRSTRPSATVSAREVLVQAQRLGGRKYVYSRATAAALAEVNLPRPDERAPLLQLEGALEQAGFRLEPLEASEKPLVRVERF